MMEFFGKLVDVTKDLVNGGYRITFYCSELPNSINDITNRVLHVVAKIKRNKRSNDANSYCWVLCTSIAEKLHTDKDSVYEDMIQKYGAPLFDDDGEVQMFSVKAKVDVSNFVEHAKFIGQGHVEGKVYNPYMVLRGSSEYDTAEMAHFIDSIVEEAKELGIDTKPICDIEKIKKKWRL